MRLCLPICLLLTTLLINSLGCGRVQVTAADFAYMPDHDTPLIAYVQRETFFELHDAVPNAPVAFEVDGRFIATGLTDEEGRVELIRRLDPPPTSDEVTIHVLSGRDRLKLLRPLHRWSNRAVVIAVDVDHTLAKTDYEGVLTDRVDRESEPYPNAARTLQRLSQHFGIIYLTARPRFLQEQTREWLELNDFPSAPILTTYGASAVLKQAEVKTDILRLHQRIWPTLLIGIGDKSADVQAYANNNMLSIIRAPLQANTEYKNLILMPDWDAIDRFFQTHAATLQNPDQLADVLARNAGTELVLPE